MEIRRCGTSPYCGAAREPTDCRRPTSGFWRALSTCSEEVGLSELCSGDGTRVAVWTMFYPYSRYVGPKGSGNCHSLRLDRDPNGADASTGDGAEDCRKSTLSQRPGSR